MPTLHPYPSYRNLRRLPWLGQIPAHWEVKRLKHCVSEFYPGGTPESGNQDYWSLDDEGISWVAIGDMTRAEIVQSTEKKLTKEGLKSKNLRVLPSGTLLYSMYASLGKVAILGIPAATNQAILSLLPKSTLDKFFLKYWLQRIEADIFQISSSNTQDNLNANKVKNIPIFLPPFAE